MDVILISEMEDLDTVSLALTAAEMGHLVIAALPTQNAVASIERIVECFPDHRQHQIRSQLSDVLAGVIPSSFFRDWMEADVWRRLKFFWQIRR